MFTHYILAAVYSTGEWKPYGQVKQFKLLSFAAMLALTSVSIVRSTTQTTELSLAIDA
jgi:hypothetical protein